MTDAATMRFMSGCAEGASGRGARQVAPESHNGKPHSEFAYYLAMMTQSEIQPYLQDYETVTGTKADKFIDPLTLDRCELADIIRGHIVNEKIPYEYNEKVLVRGKPDFFFGSRVEAKFIEFASLSSMDAASRLARQSTLTVKFRPDGPIFQAFLVKPEKVEDTRNRIPVVSVSRDGVQLHLGLKDVRLGDPDIPKESAQGAAEIHWQETHMPAHWAAAMLKTGFLTLFRLFGYRAVFDPSCDPLRRTLAQYFYDRAARSDAPKYFRQFRNAVRIVGHGFIDPENYRQFDLDVLRDRKFFVHMNSNRMFALTLMYKFVDKTLSVILPQSFEGGDIAFSTSQYDRLLANQRDLIEQVYLARFDTTGFHVEEPVQIHYQAEETGDYKVEW